MQSSLSDVDKTIRQFEESGLDAMVIAEKKFPFETIVVVRAVFH